MFRRAHVLLTIWGMLACPLLCRDEPVSACAPACCSTDCCGHDDCCPARGEGSKTPCAPSNGCETHGCICSGAVEVRHELSLDVQLDEIAWLALPLFADPELCGADSLPGLSDAPPFPPISSGRDARVFFGSLLI